MTAQRAPSRSRQKKTDRYTGSGRDKLICPHCSFSQNAEELLRYRAKVSGPCSYCNALIDVLIPNNQDKVEQLRYACPHCGSSAEYVPVNMEHRLKYSAEQIADPVFGLPLWFIGNVKENVLWAYNREHLLEIRNYVIARLRERQTMNFTTMVEKLPQFIKAARTARRF